MRDWKRISELPAREQNKLRWLLRHAGENGIVEAGVAVKYGREWLVNQERLPAFLREQTLASLAVSESGRN